MEGNTLENESALSKLSKLFAIDKYVLQCFWGVFLNHNVKGDRYNGLDEDF